MLYDSIYVNVQNRQIYRDKLQISGCLGVWGGGGIIGQKWGVTDNGYKFLFWGRNIIKLHDLW